MPPEPVTLEQAQLSAIATSVAEMMMKRQDDLDKDKADNEAAKSKADADAAAAAAAAEAKPKSDKTNNTQGFSMEELVTAVTGALKDTQQEDANKVYETLFNDKLASATGTVPGLQEFLEGKDDFGNVRMDVLKGDSDYQQRINKLESVTDSYKQAMAANGGQAPTVSKKAKEAAEANETKYNKIDEKWEKGEYDNVADFTNDFFQLLAEEAGSLS